MNIGRRLLAAVGVLALCLAAIGLGYAVRAGLPGLGIPAVVAQDIVTPDTDTTEDADETGDTEEAPGIPPALAEMIRGDGQTYGKVRIGEREVIETRGEASGFGPYERASIAAARITLALEAGIKPDDFEAISRDEEWIVIAKDRAIISVAPGDVAEDSTAEELAGTWAANISMALHEAMGTTPGGDVAMPPFVVEAKDRDGLGAVLVNGQEVFAIVAPTPGLTAVERADLVAKRFQQAFEDGVLPRDIRADTLQGMAIVKAGEMLVATVAPDDAQTAGKSGEALARDWAAGLAGALDTYYAQAGKPLAATAGEWQPREPYDDKWVPIVSILEGVKLGLARVNGPRSRLRLVQAVAQFETHWKDHLEIDVYIPISTKVPGKTIKNVKGCAVTGLGDIKL